MKVLAPPYQSQNEVNTVPLRASTVATASSPIYTPKLLQQKIIFLLFLRCRVTSWTLIGHTNHSIFSSHHSCLTLGNGYTDIHGTRRLRAQKSHSDSATISKKYNYVRLSLYPDLFLSLRVGGGRQDFSYETPKEHEDNAHMVQNAQSVPHTNSCRIRSPINRIRSEERIEPDAERHKAVTKDEDRRKRDTILKDLRGN